MRSSLTMLGVFIGVAALIAMVAVGQGANEAVLKQIASLGTNLVVVVPGATTTGGVRGGLGSASTLTVSDAQAIRREAPAVGSVGYLIRQSGQVQYSGQNWTTGIQGVSSNYPPMTNWRIAAGRSISPDDQAQAALVVVLGQTVARQLFGADQNPIGALLQVKSVPMRVIGVLDAKGQTSYGTDQDDLVMIPFSTAERKVLGVAAPSQQQADNWIYLPPPNPYGLQPRLVGFVNQIYVQAMDQSQVQPAVRQVTQTLARRHRIRPGEVNDFSVRNLSQIAETAEGSSRIMAILLAAVASISLLVGGIGIMNILLVSVTERTREIGLRMAIGARRLHVLLQFLAEAVFLSVTGGVAGIIMGSVFSAGDLGHLRLGGADLAHRDRRWVSVLRRGRHFLRLLSGAQSRTPRSDRSAAIRVVTAVSLTRRQHSLQHAVAADEIMIERGRRVQTDQRQHQVVRQQAVHVAGPVPARHARCQQLGQLKPEHDDRETAPRRAHPAQHRHREQQRVKQPMDDARGLHLPGRDAVERLRLGMRRPPGEAHDRDAASTMHADRQDAG